MWSNNRVAWSTATCLCVIKHLVRSCWPVLSTCIPEVHMML